jgi:hypothetical protein
MQVSMQIMSAFAALNFLLLVAAVIKAYELVQLFRQSEQILVVMKQVLAHLQVEAVRQETLISIVEGVRKSQNVLNESVTEEVIRSIDLMGEELDRMAKKLEVQHE